MSEATLDAEDRAVAEAIAALPPLRVALADAGMQAKKSLGQHFLFDLNITSRIAGLAGDLTQGTTIEIGPGPGGLTRALLAAGARNLVAVERDERATALLAPIAKAAQGRFDLIAGDAMQVDCAALGPAPRRIVANLPYNVATPLLVGWLKQADAFDRLVLMFQKEVAERITAAPGDDAFGRLAVLANWRCRTAIAMHLPARAFTPPPKVDSAVVILIPRDPAPTDCTLEALEKVTAAAFGQRRKMLRRSLASLGGEALLEKLGIDPTQRAEELEIADFVKIAAQLS